MTVTDSSSLLPTDWADAEWDVSGAFAHDRELILFYDFCLNALGVRPFSVVHGSPLFVWNCGRVLPQFIRSAEEIYLIAKTYLERNISMDLTFTNMALEEKHLSHPLGNALLTLLSNNNPTGRNAAILASDLLYDHVKKNYPELKTVSSILKVSCEKGKGKIDYYRKLAEKYDKVMIHPDDVFNFDLLEKLEDKDRYELIVNEYCIRHCPIRALHYRVLSQWSLDYLGFPGDKAEDRMAKNGCSSLEVLATHPRHFAVALSHDELKKAYDMGFRKFKVQGRGHANASLSLFDLLRLTLKEDTLDENRMHLLKLQFLESIAAPHS